MLPRPAPTPPATNKMGAEQSTAAPTDVAPQAASAAGATDEVAWTAAADGEAPSPRVGAGGTLKDSLVLVGGHGSDEELADVWSLTSGAWHRLAPEGRAPRPRGGHTVVAIDGIGLVVFGGLSWVLEVERSCTVRGAHTSG